jgi:hypothetical protein
MSLDIPPVPEVLHNKIGETYITLSLPTSLPRDVTSIRIYVREFPKDWDTAKTYDFPIQKLSSDNSSQVVVQTAKISGLFPTSTVECKMAYLFNSGKVSECGPSTSIDTLAAGCTPSSEDSDGKAKQKKKCIIA